MLPLEGAGAGAGLVGTEALDGLDALLRGQEAGGGDVVVEEPVDEGSTGYGNEANEKEYTDAGQSPWNGGESGLTSAIL